MSSFNIFIILTFYICYTLASNLNNNINNQNETFGVVYSPLNNSVCNTFWKDPLNPICFGRGQCINNEETDYKDVCICDSRYAKTQCEYDRRFKTTAFVLSVLFGWIGCDYFYLGYIGLGVGKLLVCLLGGLVPCLIGGLISMRGDSSSSKFFGCVTCLLGLAGAAWYFACIIMIVIDHQLDVNNYSLVRW